MLYWQFGFRGDERATGARRRGDRDRDSLKQRQVAQLVDPQRVTTVRRGAEAPAGPEVGPHLDHVDRQTLDDLGQRPLARHADVVAGPRHRRGRCDQQRALGQLGQQGGQREAVLAAAERDRGAVARTVQPHRFKRRPHVHQLGGPAGTRSVPVCLELHRRVVDQAHPELCLTGSEADRQLHPAGAQQGPVRIQADQQDPPPQGVRDRLQVELRREGHPKVGPLIQIGHGSDVPAKANVVSADLRLVQAHAMSRLERAHDIAAMPPVSAGAARVDHPRDSVRPLTSVIESA